MSIIKLNNNGVKNATAFGSITGLGSMTFIKKLTASSSSTLSFIDGSSDVVLDNTYKEYLFTFTNVHPSTSAHLQFQGNAAGGSGFNETMTTTMWGAFSEEDSSSANSFYTTADDQGNGTAFQSIVKGTNADNDTANSGYLRLFNPSGTVGVKHFIAFSSTNGSDESDIYFTSGYFNTTLAIDEIQFKMGSGNIDAGDFCLYGIA